MEQTETYVAYVQLLDMLRTQSESASFTQETGPLYDEIFYVADSIEGSNWDWPIAINVWAQSFVRLNDKINVPWLPTVTELRNKTQEGILFSGVGAIQIQTKDGMRISLLQRYAWAPTDAGKYTLPAGRADKTPGLTAYEEVLEELVLFGKKDNKLQLIIPFIENGGISEGKALQLVSIARGQYINTLLKSNENISIESIYDLISAEPIIIPLHVTEWWRSVRTIFHDAMNWVFHEVMENGIYPVHDEKANTYEMVRSFSLDLQDFDEVISGDGDGFGRNIRLFTLDEIKGMDLEKEAVASLHGAIWLGVFDKHQ